MRLDLLVAASALRWSAWSGRTAVPRMCVDWQAEIERASWMVPATALPLPEEAYSVQTSLGKGDGLFATRSIAKGTYLFDYVGTLISDDECARMPDLSTPCPAIPRRNWNNHAHLQPRY